MSETKKEILRLLATVKRAGMEDIISWLKDSDFFTSPGSTKYHGNYSGGLADHTLNVYDSLLLLNTEYFDEKSRYPEETIIIAALLHDVCKIGTYILDEEPASEKQVNYLKDLMNKRDDIEYLPKEDQRTKAYISKLIEYYKDGGTEFPKFSESFKVKEDFPMGHGEKSVYLIQKYMDLTDVEALAIRWHLGMCDPGTHHFYPSGVAHRQSTETIPLVSMLFIADYSATWLVDVKK